MSFHSLGAFYALAFWKNQEGFNQFCPSRNRDPHVPVCSTLYHSLSHCTPFNLLIYHSNFSWWPFFFGEFSTLFLFLLLPISFSILSIYSFFFCCWYSFRPDGVCALLLPLVVIVVVVVVVGLIVFYVFFGSYCCFQLSSMDIYLRINACLNCVRGWPLVRIHMFYGKRILCDYFLRWVLSYTEFICYFMCWTFKLHHNIGKEKDSFSSFFSLSFYSSCICSAHSDFGTDIEYTQADEWVSEWMYEWVRENEWGVGAYFSQKCVHLTM